MQRSKRSRRGHADLMGVMCILSAGLKARRNDKLFSQENNGEYAVWRAQPKEPFACNECVGADYPHKCWYKRQMCPLRQRKVEYLITEEAWRRHLPPGNDRSFSGSGRRCESE